MNDDSKPALRPGHDRNTGLCACGTCKEHRARLKAELDEGPAVWGEEIRLYRQDIAQLQTELERYRNACAGLRLEGIKAAVEALEYSAGVFESCGFRTSELMCRAALAELEVKP